MPVMPCKRGARKHPWTIRKRSEIMAATQKIGAGDRMPSIRVAKVGGGELGVGFLAQRVERSLDELVDALLGDRREHPALVAPHLVFVVVRESPTVPVPLGVLLDVPLLPVLTDGKQFPDQGVGHLLRAELEHGCDGLSVTRASVGDRQEACKAG